MRKKNAWNLWHSNPWTPALEANVWHWNHTVLWLTNCVGLTFCRWATPPQLRYVRWWIKLIRLSRNWQISMGVWLVCFLFFLLLNKIELYSSLCFSSSDPHILSLCHVCVPAQQSFQCGIDSVHIWNPRLKLQLKPPPSNFSHHYTRISKPTPFITAQDDDSILTFHWSLIHNSWMVQKYWKDEWRNLIFKLWRTVPAF